MLPPAAAIGGIVGAGTSLPADPVIPKGPPTTFVPPTTGDPTLKPDDGKQPPPVAPVDPNPPQQGDATGDPFVIVKETRIGTTLPTFPAFATGLAIGMGVSALSGLIYEARARAARKRKRKE